VTDDLNGRLVEDFAIDKVDDSDIADVLHLQAATARLRRHIRLLGGGRAIQPVPRPLEGPAAAEAGRRMGNSFHVKTHNRDVKRFPGAVAWLGGRGDGSWRVQRKKSGTGGGRQGDKETRRQGDKETRRQGDKETRRQGDKETRRQGEKQTARTLNRD